MRYSGSKKRYVKELLPILMEHVDENTLFVDIFGGGMNVVSEVPHKLKWANDIDNYLIQLWQHIKQHGMEGIPMSVTEDEYNAIRRTEIDGDGKYPDWLIGYVSVCCSYGSKVWGGYARYNDKRGEDHIKEASNNLSRQVSNFKYLEDTRFFCLSYDDMVFPSNTVIYCDPPYAETVGYRSSFDHEKFWQWVRKMSMNGIRVYVSEYTAPEDFVCVWEHIKKDGMRKYDKVSGNKKLRTERLFVWECFADK